MLECEWCGEAHCVCEPRESRRYHEVATGKWRWELIVHSIVYAAGNAMSRRECDAAMDNINPI